ncbi:Pre-mRNA-splicing factor Cwf15/Cwc15 [Mycena leptocephala]|nr:Pre-mRNA-splicing factor Cwf15/Cwc15 [Mycena leptocephala]
MSTAHRPTWDPAPAKDVKGGSRQFSVRDKTSKQGSNQIPTSMAEVKQRDLRSELFAAESDAKNKERKAEGLPPLAVEGGPADEESNKQRKLLQDSLDLGEDDDDKEDADTGKDKDADDRLWRFLVFDYIQTNLCPDRNSDSDEDDDDTTELLRELEKIKRERAEEKAPQEREHSASE